MIGGWRLPGRRAPRRAADGAQAAECEQWRPEAWLRHLDAPRMTGATSPSAFGTGLTLFHDCPLSDIALAQSGGDAAEFASSVEISIAQFAGSYLSLVIDLPPDRAQPLTAEDILCLALRLTNDRAHHVSARLNLRTGPNLVAMTRMPVADGAKGRLLVEFDLGRSDLGERRVSAAWLDLIFDAPAPGRIVVDDLGVSRHRRAGF
ncbi:DUF6478 family protein [Citreimonas sp.]|uniref:DUF6478 family protein n=1 Tax=Citreimonas sp. TaxID=3036715 RepID=UPI004058BD42